MFGASGRATANLNVLPESVVITGLFNTGVGANRAPLADNAVDSHYALTYGNTPYTPYVTTAVGGFPIPPWLGDSDGSAWITPLALQYPVAGTNADIAIFYYLLSFDTGSLDQSTASITGRWAVARWRTSAGSAPVPLWN